MSRMNNIYLCNDTNKMREEHQLNQLFENLLYRDISYYLQTKFLSHKDRLNLYSVNKNITVYGNRDLDKLQLYKDHLYDQSEILWKQVINLSHISSKHNNKIINQYDYILEKLYYLIKKQVVPLDQRDENLIDYFQRYGYLDYIDGEWKYLGYKYKMSSTIGKHKFRTLYIDLKRLNLSEDKNILYEQDKDILYEQHDKLIKDLEKFFKPTYKSLMYKIDKLNRNILHILKKYTLAIDHKDLDFINWLRKNNYLDTDMNYLYTN
jgi:hypothetical protein